ncbi:MAG: hypothetical protein AAB847_01465, partial [Patescibacteria group bacterium]
MKKGVVVIPTVLMLGGLLAVIALTGSLIVYLLSRSNFNIRLSAGALLSAKTGLQDGVLRLIRDTNFISSAGYDPTGESKNQVKINVILSNVDVVRKEIISVGCASARYRQLRGVVEINKNTGELKVLSIEEVPA